ncbi:MAG: LysR family transcriptional regulator [Fibrobacter sp.]|nr:LysR family transcriptional regulator [Fibrobacter sp.]
MIPDYNRLHIFYQVFRHSSIARAAAALFVTQSAISQSLQKLEQELDIPLFHRYPKKLVPTPAAERLFESIMPFFSTFDSTIESIHSTEKNPHGLLRIGAPPVFGAQFLPAIISDFRAAYPAVKFHLSLAEQTVIADAYRNSNLEVALVDLFGNKEEEEWNLLQEPLIDEHLVLVASSHYIKSRPEFSPSYEHLQNCQFIAYKPQAPELTEWFSHHFGTITRHLDIVLTVENVHAVIAAVKSHLGLGIVPLYLVESALKTNELTLINTGKDELRSRISLLRHPGRNPGLAERLFIELIRENLRRIATIQEQI